MIYISYLLLVETFTSVAYCLIRAAILIGSGMLQVFHETLHWSLFKYTIHVIIVKMVLNADCHNRLSYTSTNARSTTFPEILVNKLRLFSLNVRVVLY